MINTARSMKGALLASSVLLTLPFGVAQAAEAPAPAGASAAVQEVVVTARKREETLLDAPITVQALTATDLARNPTSDLQLVAAMLPNVTAVRTGSGTLGSFNIRGIGTSSGDSGVDQAITVVIDDVPIARGTAAAANYFDLANVQVLPGPQALYFGKNASGGVIALQTAGPTATFEASMKAGYEFNARERYLDAAVSGPLSDTLRARLAVHASEMDGWMHNDAGPIVNPIETTPSFQLQPGASHDRIGDSHSVAARLTLEYKPSSPFSATLKALVSRYHSDEISGNTEVVSCAAGQTHPHQFNMVDTYGDCTANGRTSIGDMNPALAQFFPKAKGGQGYLNANGVQGSLKLQYDAGKVLFTSVTGYYDMHDSGLGNFSYSSFDYFPGVNTSDERVLTEELRFNTKFDGPLNFIGGVYADRGRRLSSTIGRGLLFGVLPQVNTATAIAGSDIALPTAIGYYPEHKATTHTYSAFLEGAWDITANLQLDGGVRVTRVSEDSLGRNRYIAPFYLSLTAGAATGAPCNSLGLPVATACLFVPPTDRVALAHKEHNVSPEVTLSWHPSPDMTLYAAYKSGYKPGAVSNPSVLLESNLGGDPTRNLNFGPEKSKGGEVGAKASLLDGALTVNSSIYYYEFNGLQLSTFDSTTTSFLIRNAGSAITKGAEVQAAYAVTPELTLRTTIDYNKGYFSDYRNVACYVSQTAAQGCSVPARLANGTVIPGRFVQDLSGSALSNAPRWVVLGGVSWNTALANGLRLGLDGDVKYSAHYRTNNTGTPLAVQGSYAKFNAGVRIGDEDGRWEAALIGRNLTNKFVIVGATANPGTGNAQDGFAQQLTGIVERGREIVLQISLKR